MKKSYFSSFTILLVIGIYLLIAGLLLSFTDVDNKFTPSIYSLLSADHLWGWLLPLATTISLSSALMLLLPKLGNKIVRSKTALYTLAFSFFGSCGCVFLINLSKMFAVEDVARYPYALPTFMVCALVCILLCIALLIISVYQRIKQSTLRDFWQDCILLLFAFPTFFILNVGIIHWLWNVLSLFI